MSQPAQLSSFSRWLFVLVYYFVFAPMGIVMRVLNIDPLHLKLRRSAVSYWIEGTGEGHFFQESYDDVTQLWHDAFRRRAYHLLPLLLAAAPFVWLWAKASAERVRVAHESKISPS